MGSSKLTSFQVSGRSMIPLLNDGDIVGVSKEAFKQGDIIVYEDHGLKKIKLIKSIKKENIEVAGINKGESESSKLIKLVQIIGKVQLIKTFKNPPSSVTLDG